MLLSGLCAEKPVEEKKGFKVSAGNAARTLKQAAEQGGVDIVFSADMVKGVTTHSIKGNYTPKEALNLMLRGSLLVAVKHQKSGVFFVKRKELPIGRKL